MFLKVNIILFSLALLMNFGSSINLTYVISKLAELEAANSLRQMETEQIFRKMYEMENSYAIKKGVEVEEVTGSGEHLSRENVSTVKAELEQLKLYVVREMQLEKQENRRIRSLLQQTSEKLQSEFAAAVKDIYNRLDTFTVLTNEQMANITRYVTDKQETLEESFAGIKENVNDLKNRLNSKHECMDYELLEINSFLDNQTQKGTTPAPVCAHKKMDLVFVIDASTSVTEENFIKQLQFVKSVIRLADVDSGNVRIGSLIFGTDVEIQFHLNEYKTNKDLIVAVDKIPYIQGATNTADALMTMRDSMFGCCNGDRDDALNKAIVITDGVSNINARRTIPEAVKARDEGIQIYAVGIGIYDRKELDKVVSPPPSENVYLVENYEELEAVVETIFKSMCAGVF